MPLQLQDPAQSPMAGADVRMGSHPNCRDTIAALHLLVCEAEMAYFVRCLYIICRTWVTTTLQKIYLQLLQRTDGFDAQAVYYTKTVKQIQLTFHQIDRPQHRQISADSD